jgi:hypothetical protein
VVEHLPSMCEALVLCPAPQEGREEETHLGIVRAVMWQSRLWRGWSVLGIEKAG